MNKRILFIIALGFLVLMNFSLEAQTVIDLDLKNNLEKKQVFNVKQIASSVDLIPLETKKECLLGDIVKVVRVEDLFLVLGNNSKLFVFDKKGKFLRQIGKQGRGPKEYIYLADFSYSASEKLVYINSVGELLKFSVDGSFVEKSKLPNSFFQVSTVSDDAKIAFISPVSPQNKAGENYDLVSVFSSDIKEEKVFKTKCSKQVGCAMFSWIYSKGNMIYYKDEFSDDVCVLNKRLDKMIFMHLGLQDLLITPDVFDFSKRDEWNKFYRMKGFMDFEHYCLIKMQHGLAGSDFVPVIYDKINKSVIVPSDEDGSNGLWWSGLELMPVGCDGNCLLSSLAVEDIVDNSDMSDKRLVSLSKSIDIEANPVLAIARLK